MEKKIEDLEARKARAITRGDWTEARRLQVALDELGSKTEARDERINREDA